MTNEVVLDICLNCLKEISDPSELPLDFGICDECWEEVAEHWGVGVIPFERKPEFDDAAQ